ncbi:putative transcriptional regulator [Rhizobium sp. RU20A]|uniref:YqgE/AlgH family protein n=1 Tax=Rhizobium sp. RU20A TaxID=1907412 RepID=UPI000957006D|nr:YqgE/AlgH family protein [Rhizobium sp. RU20A]SIR10345.1 putative transcriptional regulator [Rhizobium sp. RU20A]
MAITMTQGKRERGVLDGQFLIAMPQLADTNFARTVVYICAHSGDGAMGFVLNRPQTLTFPDVLLHLDIIQPDQAIKLPDSARNFRVQTGGPVETGRGFVLHSDDYMSDSSIPVSDEICLTATLDIVRAISRGHGPSRAMLMLGYASWAPGQLEGEIAQNSWLNCPARDDLIFDSGLGDKYDRVLHHMGVTPAMLSMDTGHA